MPLMPSFTPATQAAPAPLSQAAVSSGTFLLPIVDLTTFDEPDTTFDFAGLSFDGYTSLTSTTTPTATLTPAPAAPTSNWTPA